MYGQMTAGSWIYIGSQGILQGTFETFAEAARQHFSGTLEGKLVVTGGQVVRVVHNHYCNHERRHFSSC